MSKFYIGENGAVISDPCYSLDTWCQGKIGNIKSGNYEVELEYIDNRVSKLIARHELHPNSYPDIHVPFDIGVDSGTCGIWDYDYYAKYHSPELDEDWYDKNVCDQVENDHCMYICDQLGVWSESGYGDGSYNCYVAMDNENRDVVAVAIEYIIDDFDDEYDEEEEEW